MSEEMNDLCHKLLKEWCPKGFRAKGNAIYQRGGGNEWYVFSLSPNDGGAEEPSSENCILAIFRSGKMDAWTTMGPATIYNIRTVLDLSDPKSTEFLKELITNLRRKE